MKISFSIALFWCLSLLWFSKLQCAQPSFSCKRACLIFVLAQGKLTVSCLNFDVPDKLIDTRKIVEFDLLDSSQAYDKLICDSSSNGLLVVKSSNGMMCDYYFNWGAFFGTDLSSYAQIFPVKMIMRQENQGWQITSADPVIYDQEKSLTVSLGYDHAPRAAVAFLVPEEIANQMSCSPSNLTFVEGCKLGIIVTKHHEELITVPAQDQEIEFEQILDAMVKDGTISIKPVSPFMATLKSVGSSIFMKYLALKNIVKSWFCSHPADEPEVNCSHPNTRIDQSELTVDAHGA